MAASGAKTLTAIGFLTVTQNAEWGLTGGLLILNAAGRPLEFHCTAPIKPNRAQEILYGPTLHPFLYGEQIGRALVDKVKSEMLFLCTNVWPAMYVRHETKLPVVLIQERIESPHEPPRASADQHAWRVDPAHPSPPTAHARLTEFTLGRQPAAVLAEYESDLQCVVEHWRSSHEQLDLSEPFGRIREAIDEAQRGANQ